MSTTELTPVRPETATLRGFFDAISRRYDFLNEILSFHLDESWRSRSCDAIYEPSQEAILDLGIGTGKFLRLFLDKKTWRRSCGLDFAARMLGEARRQLPSGVRYVNGDFQKLPFERTCFDAVISAFTLRSVQNMPSYLSEIFRVLRPNGRVGLLCLTRPNHPLFNLIYYPYLKFYLPVVGGLVSGNRRAYEFLANSILNFQEPETTAAMMRENGFLEVEVRRFTFGAATLILGRKPHEIPS